MEKLNSKILGDMIMAKKLRQIKVSEDYMDTIFRFIYKTENSDPTIRFAKNGIAIEKEERTCYSIHNEIISFYEMIKIIGKQPGLGESVMCSLIPEANLDETEEYTLLIQIIPKQFLIDPWTFDYKYEDILSAEHGQ